MGGRIGVYPILIFLTDDGNFAAPDSPKKIPVHAACITFASQLGVLLVRWRRGYPTQSVTKEFIQRPR